MVFIIMMMIGRWPGWLLVCTKITNTKMHNIGSNLTLETDIINGIVLVISPKECCLECVCYDNLRGVFFSKSWTFGFTTGTQHTI